MVSDAEHIRGWYKALKANSTCITGKRVGEPPAYGRVEFHHMKASTKLDTLSSMAIKPLIPCLSYTIEPVTFALELMKVVPLAPERHKELHRADDKADWQTLHEQFDFDRDPFYRSEVRAFRTMALDLAPAPILTKVHEGLSELLERASLIFAHGEPQPA